MTSDLIELLARVTIALSAAIALVFCVRVPVRNAFGPAVAYRLWLIVPIAALASLLPAGSSTFPVLEISFPEAGQAPTFAPGPDATSAYTQASPALDWSLAVAGVWLAGACACVALVLREHRRAVRAFGDLTEETLHGTRICRTVTPDVGPSLLGVFNLKLIVPADFEARFTPAEQRLILAHEDHHRRAGDPVVNGLVAALRCLNWFNPLVHIAAVVLRIDQELACDAAVLAARPRERRAYAEALVKTQISPDPTPLGCHWPVKSHALLLERLQMLTLDKPGRLRLIAGALTISLISFGAGAAAWATLAPHARPIEEAIPEAALPGARTPPGVNEDVARAAPAPAPGQHYAPFPAANDYVRHARAEVVSEKVDLAAIRARLSGAPERNRRAQNDPERIAAAVKGGWTHEVLAAGGSPADVVASLRSEGWKDSMLPLAGTEQFAVLSDGEFGIAGVTRDGALVIINDDGFDEWPDRESAPNAAALKARLGAG